jgi:D-arabinose 1-dehydrogenase-like Zn-dependent alcohol dehydrogenase
VNPIDVYIRSGAIPAKLSFPFILGRDVAGTVVEAGPGVKDFKPGDRVWATSQGSDGRPGTFAEFAAVDHRWLHPIPEGVSDEDIVALSLVGVTPSWPGAERQPEGRGDSVCERRFRRRRLRVADGQISARVITTAGATRKSRHAGTYALAPINGC